MDDPFKQNEDAFITALFAAINPPLSTNNKHRCAHFIFIHTGLCERNGTAFDMLVNKGPAETVYFLPHMNL